MAIPLNIVDIEKQEKLNQDVFEKEVEILENHVFKNPAWKIDKNNIETLYLTNYVKSCNGDHILDHYGFKPSEEHMKKLIANIKAAGYCVYAKHYHNGYYGVYEIMNYYVTKVPLTLSQREIIGLQKGWSRPWGPGQEQHKGERL